MARVGMAGSPFTAVSSTGPRRSGGPCEPWSTFSAVQTDAQLSRDRSCPRNKKRATEKQKQDSVAAVYGYFADVAKVATRTNHVSLKAAATVLYATPTVPPSPYEVNIEWMDVLEDCGTSLQQEITVTRLSIGPSTYGAAFLPDYRQKR